MRPLTVLSYGSGQDSTAMLYMYAYDKAFRDRYAPGEFLVIHSDTGDEHPATYEHTEYIKWFCFMNGIEFVHLTPNMGFHSPSWPSLRSFYYRTSTVGSKAFRKTCTDQLKIGPIYRFLEKWIGEHYGTTVSRKKGYR